MAGHLLCSSCDHLFGRFLMPCRRPASDRMKDAFQAWDRNKSGTIEVEELKGVMKGLNPDFPERDLDKIMRVIDTNGNGVIEYEEFVNWIMAGSPLEAEDGFEAFVNKLMTDAGVAHQKDCQEVEEVMVRNDGVVFRLRNGKEIFSTKAVASESVQLTNLEPEEFIKKAEMTEDGLKFYMNTGRVATLPVKSLPFGPWVAPEGFHIIGFRSKPLKSAEDGSIEEKVVGIDLAPLPGAQSYDTFSALAYAAEHEYLFTLRSMLAKAAIDVNGFSPWGSTPLMLAAQQGNVGSLRLLLSSKAKVGIADADGWTALTFASQFGHTSAVDLLVEKGAQEPGDGCTALTEALRHQHNSTARALLRAGFGPAPAGAFALEDLPDQSKYTLDAPLVNPPGSVFHGPVTVELLIAPQKMESDADTIQPEEKPEEKREAEPPEELKAAEETKTEEAPAQVEKPPEIYYTLDGRDPFLQGRRYRGGPLVLSGARTHLRAVAIRGQQQSRVVDEIFVVCHYAIPEDVLTGSLQVLGPPMLRPKIQAGLAKLLKVPIERVIVEANEPERSTHFGKWLCVPICDPRPRHALKIDQNFARIRGKEKLGPFVTNLTSDIEKACGVKPENMIVTADHRGGRAEFRAGCINAEFCMAREPAEELVRQLATDSSYLLTQAQLRTYLAESDLHLVKPVGLRLMDQELLDKILEQVKKKLVKGNVKRIVGVGVGDLGTIAVDVSGDCSKIPPIVMTKIVGAALPDYPGLSIAEIKEFPEECSFNYTIDVISSSQLSVEDKTVRISDASSFMKDLNCPEFMENFNAIMEESKLRVEVTDMVPTSSRGLSQLEFHLQWDKPANATPEDLLDGVCFIYNGSQLLQVLDYRASISEQEIHDGELTKEKSWMGRSINRAIQHSGDDVTSTGGQHRIAMDLDAFPLSVTDLYFVMASSGGEGDGPRDLSAFRNTRVEIHDVVLGRMLTEYKIPTGDKAQARVMCKLSRDPDHNKWVVHGLGIPSEGSVRDYAPIRSLLADRQAGYLRWQRRKHLVVIRVLWKKRRMTEGATNEFALLCKRVLGLPLLAFQCLVKLF